IPACNSARASTPGPTAASTPVATAATRMTINGLIRATKPATTINIPSNTSMVGPPPKECLRGSAASGSVFCAEAAAAGRLDDEDVAGRHGDLGRGSERLDL